MRVTKIQRKFRRVSLHSLLPRDVQRLEIVLDAVTDEEVFHSHVFFGCHRRLTDQNGDHFAAHVLQRRRLGEKLRLSLWAWTFEDMGNRTASWSSDGGLQSVRSFDITRNKWVDWKDQFGKAHVPMAQRLEITTEHHTISLN